MDTADGSIAKPGVTSMAEVVRCVIPEGGALDVATASALCARLAEMGPAASLVVDLHQARQVTDAALAALVRGTWAVRARVFLRGLSRHQQRVLTYLGFAAEQGPARGTAPSTER
jgi:anti-anti-sigma regulatory factor